MKRKFIVILTTILIAISLLTINIYAATYSFKTNITPGSSSAEQGTDVTFTVSISDLNVGDNGISGFSATLYYDSDVFEDVTESNVEGLNGFTATYSETSGEIVLIKNGFVTSDSDIMQITLTVKSGISTGTEGIVTLSNIIASNSDEDINGSTVSQTITVGTSSGSDVETITLNGSDSDTDDVTVIDEDTSINISTDSSEETETEDDDMPYTGSDTSAYIRIILGVVIVAFVIYIEMKKLNENLL